MHSAAMLNAPMDFAVAIVPRLPATFLWPRWPQSLGTARVGEKHNKYAAEKLKETAAILICVTTESNETFKALHRRIIKTKNNGTQCNHKQQTCCPSPPWQPTPSFIGPTLYFIKYGPQRSSPVD
jgi:hypothetical protein